MLRRLAGEDAGAAAIEYAMLAGVIAITLVAVLALLGHDLDSNMRNVNDAVPHRIVVQT